MWNNLYKGGVGMFNEEIVEMSEMVKNGTDISLMCPKCDIEMEFGDEMNDSDDSFLYNIVIYICPLCDTEVSFNSQQAK